MPRLNRSVFGLTAIIILIILHYSLGDSDPVSTTTTHASSSWTSYAGGGKVAAWAGGRGSKSTGSTEGSSSIGGGGSSEGVEIDKRGLAVVHTTIPLAKHPIEALIERGKKLAAAQQAKWDEAESLEDSVDDYTTAFGMAPPKGYDSWYKFTQMIKPSSNPLPSLMPLVHDSFVPMLSHDGATMRERVVEMREKTHHEHWTFTFVPPGTGDRGTACGVDEDWHPGAWHTRGKGSLLVRGQAAWSWRCNNTLELFLPMLPLMPPELFTMNPPFEMVFSLNDGPRSVVHDGFKQRSRALGQAGKLWPKAQLFKQEQEMEWTHGWQWMCPEGSPLKVANTDTILNDLDGSSSEQTPLGDSITSKQSKSFIADTDAAADFCHNPSIFSLHNMLLIDEHISPHPFSPCVSMCKTARSADIVGVPLDAVWEDVEYVPWSGKTNNKAFWRGSATGLYHNKRVPWRQSQRERLHWFAQNQSTSLIPILVDRSSEGKGVVTEEHPLAALNELWVDAGVIGGPTQCDEEDGSCAEMKQEITFLERVPKEFSTRYKYVLDLDGNGWSSRFRRLLLGNNVVLKSTIYPEWFSGMLIPWYHYVPLKLDYTDLHDIMAFFNGAPDGSTPGRDDLAQEIAQNSVNFVDTRWRNFDMQSYMYLLTLEFWRLTADDRKAYSYEST